MAEAGGLSLPDRLVQTMGRSHLTVIDAQLEGRLKRTRGAVSDRRPPPRSCWLRDRHYQRSPRRIGLRCEWSRNLELLVPCSELERERCQCQQSERPEYQPCADRDPAADRGYRFDAENSSGRKPPRHRYTRSSTTVILNPRCFRTGTAIIRSNASIGRTSAAGINDQSWNPPLIG